MLNVEDQKRLNNVVSGMTVYFVFKSAVYYDMYLPTELGMLKFNTKTFMWGQSDFNNRNDLIEYAKDKYPVYGNAHIFNNLDWKFDKDVESLSNVSFDDLWKR